MFYFQVSLSPFNDKRWFTRDGNTWSSLSYGHYRIQDEAQYENILQMEEESIDMSEIPSIEEMDIDEELVDMLASLVNE